MMIRGELRSNRPGVMVYVVAAGMDEMLMFTSPLEDRSRSSCRQ